MVGRLLGRGESRKMKTKMEKINELVEKRYGIPICDSLDDSCIGGHDAQPYSEAATYRSLLMQDSAEDVEKKHIHDSLIRAAHTLMESSPDKKLDKNYHSSANPPERLFSEYASRPYWSIEEAVALSFGLDPDWVFKKGKESASLLLPNSLHINKLKGRLKWALNSHEIESSVGIYDKETPLIKPADFISWAKSVGISLPEKLVVFALSTIGEDINTNLDIQSYEEKITTLKHELNQCQLRCDHLEKEKKFNEKPLLTQEKESLYKMLAAAIVHAYDYDPSKKKNDKLSKMRKALNDIGHSLDDGTIRTRLDVAKDFIPSGVSSNISGKKETLHKIIAGLLVDGLGYGPTAKENSIFDDVNNALGKIKQKFDLDTIKEVINQASRYVPGCRDKKDL